MPEINTQNTSTINDNEVIIKLYPYIYDKQMMPITSVSDLIQKMYPSKYTDAYSARIINAMVCDKLVNIENRTGTTYVIPLPTNNVKTEIFKYLNYATTATIKSLVEHIPHFPAIVIMVTLERLVCDKLVTAVNVAGDYTFSMAQGEETVIKEVAFKTKSGLAKHTVEDPLTKVSSTASKLLEETTAEEPEARIHVTSTPSAELLKKPMLVKMEPEASAPIPVNVVKEENASTTMMVEVNAETLEAIYQLQKIMKMGLKFTPTIEQVVAYGIATIANLNTIHATMTGGMFNAQQPQYPQRAFSNQIEKHSQQALKNPYTATPEDIHKAMTTRF